MLTFCLGLFIVIVINVHLSIVPNGPFVIFFLKCKTPAPVLFFSVHLYIYCIYRVVVITNKSQLSLEPRRFGVRIPAATEQSR